MPLLPLLLSIFALSPRASALTYEELSGLIRDKKIQSIEALLPELPPDFRGGYTMLFKSRSLQAASPSNPRVILFGNDAQLTCAFNGEGRGTDSFECFQFRAPERRFDFRQIQFPSAKNGLTAPQFSESNRSADGKISCTACHSSDPRPNWDGYSSWPGAYGGDDDLLKGEQAEQYKAFVAQRPSHPRYKWLIQDANPEAPFYYGDGYEGRPNLLFSDFVGRMNALRATRLMKTKLSEWQTLAFAFRALNCNLTSEQSQRIAKAGLNFPADTDEQKLFDQMGLKPAEWSTQIFDDAPFEKYPIYEHQSGFSLLTLDVSMAIAQERAQAGNQPLAEGIQKILASYDSYQEGYARYFRYMNAILPDPNFFHADYPKNVAYICPELTELFVDSYAAPHQL